MISSRLGLTVLLLLAPPTMLLGLHELAPLGHDHHRREGARLRAHFDSLDAELRLAGTQRLTSAQRTSRATLIGWLREYRVAERFPRNDRFPAQAMPFFRDSRGVLCAMAYLIDRSGRPDLVDQPTYGHPPGEQDEAGISTSYAVTSILVTGSSLATVGLNALAPSRAAGWAGILAGAASFIAGAAKLDEVGTTDDVAKVNAIAGVGALTFGLYRLVTPRPSGLAWISPLLMPSVRNPRLGLSVRAAF